MKKMISLAVVSMFTVALFAQTPATTDKAVQTEKKDAAVSTDKKMETTKTAKYWCTGCEYNSEKAGVCPHHKTALVMEGYYFCPGDEAHATVKQAKCKDGTAMTHMDESYYAAMKSKEKEKKQMGEK